MQHVSSRVQIVTSHWYKSVATRFLKINKYMDVIQTISKRVIRSHRNLFSLTVNHTFNQGRLRAFFHFWFTCRDVRKLIFAVTVCDVAKLSTFDWHVLWTVGIIVFASSYKKLSQFDLPVRYFNFYKLLLERKQKIKLAEVISLSSIY